MTGIMKIMTETAREAGRLAFERRKNLPAAAVHIKTTAADLVTDADRETERFIRSALGEKCPGYGFIGEEFGASAADAEWCWCVDPIDGTTSYVHDSLVWCVSIGLLHRGKFYAGVVCVPKLGELYYGETGCGAFCNGVPLHASGCTALENSLLATGFACVRDKRPKNNLEFFCRIVPKLQGIRRDGSAAFDLCQVAAGKYDGYWEFRLKGHDIAAGVVIAREAGALVTDADGGENLTGNGLVCAAPGIHGALLAELAGHDIS